MKNVIILNMKDLPQSVKSCLWSYDVDKMDFNVSDNRTILIHNILNMGASDAISWLFENFNKEEISDVIKNTNSSDWSKKSLSLWSLIFNTKPIKAGRFS